MSSWDEDGVPAETLIAGWFMADFSFQLADKGVGQAVFVVKYKRSLGGGGPVVFVFKQGD